MNEELQVQNEIPVDEDQNTAQTSPEMMGELTPEEAKAALGLSTRLSEQFLMSQVPSQAPETAPVEGQSVVEPKERKEPVTEDPGAKMEMKNEIRTIVQEEMANLRKDIEEALMEESNEKSEA